MTTLPLIPPTPRRRAFKLISLLDLIISIKSNPFTDLLIPQHNRRPPHQKALLDPLQRLPHTPQLRRNQRPRIRNSTVPNLTQIPRRNILRLAALNYIPKDREVQVRSQPRHGVLIRQCLDKDTVDADRNGLAGACQDLVVAVDEGVRACQDPDVLSFVSGVDGCAPACVGFGPAYHGFTLCVAAAFINIFVSGSTL